AHRDSAGKPFAVDPHEVAVHVIVNHGLVRLPLLSAAQEQTAVGPEVVLHLQGHLEVAIRGIGDEKTAVAEDVLAADDGPVLDDPLAARLVLAGGAVARLGAGVPSLGRFPVEDRDEAFVAEGVILLRVLAVIGASGTANSREGGNDQAEYRRCCETPPDA